MNGAECSYCCRYIDTDDFPESYIADQCICEKCRDSLVTDGRLVVVDEEYRFVEEA